MQAQQRSEDSKAFKKIAFEFGGFKLRYAWVSQRGYYPEDLDKHNQDTHVEVENFGADAGIKDAAFFAVYDGHGKTGDHCAIFARDHMPGLFVKELAKVCVCVCVCDARCAPARPRAVQPAAHGRSARCCCRSVRARDRTGTGRRRKYAARHRGH